MDPLILVVIILLAAIFGAAPRWPYSSNWTYLPSFLLTVVLLVVLVLLLTGRVAIR